MTLEELRQATAAGEVDTVLLCIADMEARLQGKRLTASHFFEEVVEHNAEGCNYLLAVDVDMNTVSGYEMSSWERGYGDFVMKPDFDTLRRVPWHEGTALLMADLVWEDGSDVVASPRQILRKQLARLAERGWKATAGTELEFIVFNDTYEDAWKKGYRDLDPANLYNVDYSMLGTARVEPLIRRIRNSMMGAGLRVENSKGECNFGQHEINFRYDEALATADAHAIYKNGAKEIAAQEGMAITYMAKLDEREGNSCHIHCSLQNDGGNVFAGDEATFNQFVAGQLACLQELTLFFAPHVNSYKRFVPGSFAPTAVAWGHDNRTCSMRVVGHGQSLRVENRLPGADVNPYLALAAMIAAGLHGIDQQLELEPAFEGNAYDSDKPRVPHTLYAARDLFADSAVARDAFGQEVVDHYLNRANIELDASRPPSPTGRSSGASSACDGRAATGHRHLQCDRDARAGARGTPSRPPRRAAIRSRSSAPAASRCSCRPRRDRGGARRAARPARRPRPGRRRGRRPRLLRRAPAPRDGRDLARARPLRARARLPRARARPAAARHLPRHAAAERRARRHDRPAPARPDRPRGAPPHARHVRATTRSASPTARSPPAWWAPTARP